VADSTDLLQLDTSDIDRLIGKPVEGRQYKEPFSVNDIRRWVEAMHNPNPLYFDDEFAAASRFERIVAPQSYFGGGVGAGAIASIQGMIPGSHMLFGGDEFWFHGPRIYPGDRLHQERMLFDYKVTNTSFAGPTVFTRGDTTYVNQHGDIMALQRSTSIRYLVENARRLASFARQEAGEPEWTDEELEGIEVDKEHYIRSYLELGYKDRFWEDVPVGTKLPRRVIGPHSIQSFTTEKRSECTPQGWGGFASTGFDGTSVGWVPEMAWNHDRIRINPAARDGVNFGPSRGHNNVRYARLIGMPREYGYGASMGAWINDYLTNWAGHGGFLSHVRSQYRAPALAGDVTFQDAEVIDHWIDDKGRGVVQLRHVMASQAGVTTASGVGEVLLPRRG
jgi:acyl dehydratase